MGIQPAHFEARHAVGCWQSAPAAIQAMVSPAMGRAVNLYSMPGVILYPGRQAFGILVSVPVEPLEMAVEIASEGMALPEVAGKMPLVVLVVRAVVAAPASLYLAVVAIPLSLHPAQGYVSPPAVLSLKVVMVLMTRGCY